MQQSINTSRLAAHALTSSTEVLTRVTSNSASAASSILAAVSRRSMTSGGLGAPAGEPADQFLPARRGEEDQLGLGHGLADQAGALQIDLQEDGLARLQAVEDGPPRGAVAVARELGPLQQLAVGDQLVESPRRRRRSTGRRASRRGAACGWSPRPRARPRGVLCAYARRPCSCRPRRGRRARSAADVRPGARGSSPGMLQPCSDYPGSQECLRTVRQPDRRRTRAPGRRSGWSRDRAHGGSRRCQDAP